MKVIKTDDKDNDIEEIFLNVCLDMTLFYFSYRTQTVDENKDIEEMFVNIALDTTVSYFLRSNESGT